MTLPVGTTIYEWTSSSDTPPSVYTTTLEPPLGDTLYNMYGEGIGYIDSTEMGSFPSVIGTITELGYQGAWGRTAGDTTSTTVQKKIIYISNLSNGTDTYALKDSEARNSIENLATVATTGSYNDLSDKPDLTNYALDADVVHKTGNETITGQKTFSAVAYGTASDVNGSMVTTVNKSKMPEGYFKLGNGMIVQWGYASLSSQQATVTFPTSFSAADTYRFTALRRAGAATTNDGGQIFSRSRTKTTINIYASSSATGSCDWIAVGY